MSDSSGRYNGHMLFGNDNWLGSKQLCDDVNYENHKKNNDNSMEMSFSVAKILIKIIAIFPNVSEKCFY